MKAPDGSELEIVWRLRDQQSLERELERIYGNDSGRDSWLQSLLEYFIWTLQAHPREWPAASSAPSDHTFRGSGVEIRYRVFPADETVEVLSATPLRPTKA